MRHGDVILTLQWRHGSTCGQRADDVRLFLFYRSLGLVRVCEINKIHHWCSVGTEKSQPEGPPFQWETRLAEFPTERWIRGLGFFWNHWTPMIDSFSHCLKGFSRCICSRVSLVSLLLYIAAPPTFYQIFMNNGLFQKTKVEFHDWPNFMKNSWHAFPWQKSLTISYPTH